jgi:hypothetical protein
MATGGTLVFTTFAVDEGATGSYDLTYTDGTTEQGTFDVGWCPGGGQCG